MIRTAKLKRETTETQIDLSINLDGSGIYNIEIPLGFLKHMLELFSKHSMIDLNIKAKGDTWIDDHHLTEDIGILLGQAIKKALGAKKGINRYGFFTLPMDEVLVTTAIDLSGRISFETNYIPNREMVGDMSTEMVREFFGAVSSNAKMNLHMQFLNPGRNEHHRIEALFKSFARAFRMAINQGDGPKNEIPSTKGSL